MINKKISTIAGSLIILAIAMVLGWSFFAGEEKETQDQNNVVLDNSNSENRESNNNQNNQSQKEEATTFEEDLKNYPPMEQKEVDKLTDLTKDWKTFKNEEQGYEFKYPDNYSINKEHETKNVISIISNGECTDYSHSINNNKPCQIMISLIGNKNDPQIINELESIKNDYSKEDISVFTNNNKIVISDPRGFAEDISFFVQIKDNMYRIAPVLLMTRAATDKVKTVIQGIYFTLKEIN